MKVQKPLTGFTTALLVWTWVLVEFSTGKKRQGDYALCPAPAPGEIWQHLEIFLVVTTGGWAGWAKGVVAMGI